ncbi:cryptochrome-1-like isoform X2 [Melanerpes formicivorus]|uniref:cryptochrome-1-like isoform X2 n=1 Tax=Melanerpes formicivorus TaxID=211600 RepID=UPI00358EB579
MSHRSIHLFRKGLRLHDHPALLAALQSSQLLYPLYILDQQFLSSVMRMGALRWHFLLQSLQDLQESLCQLGSCLLVVQGEYEAVLRELVQQWNISQVTLDAEVEPFYKEMEARIRCLGEELGFEVLSLVGHSLYDTKRVLELNGGSPPLTYKRFLHILSLLGDPELPVRTLTAEDFQRCQAPAPGLAERYRVPLPVDLKMPPESLSPWRGGETAGLQRLEQHLADQGWVTAFTKPKTIPNSLLPSTTGLSPYFSLGCLSVRTFFHRLAKIYAQAQTGFPWIDAIMTQLRQEGWIHHLARHAAACFLTRGDLWISWEEGMKVFEELLLDADYSTNAGNWLWLSGSAFCQRQRRSLCPVRFGRRTDPHGHYIRKYLPILKNFASKHIYEPWTASEEEQKQAGCIIGQDYPFPMVNHKEVSEHNLQLMKQVREEQHRTAQLTRDETEDPMEVKARCDHSEEDLPRGKVAKVAE